MGTTHFSGLAAPESTLSPDLTVTDINGAPYVAGGGSPGNNKIWYTDNTGADVGISNSIVTGFPLVSNGGTTAPSYTALSGEAVASPGLAVGAGTTQAFIQKNIQVVYDFSVDGGTVGSTTLALNYNVPVGSFVASYNIGYRVLTTCTSAGDLATIGFSLVTDSATPLVTPIAINNAGNPWDAGVHANPTFVQPSLTTGSRQIKIDIGVEAVTAGKIQLFIPFWVVV